MVRKIFIAAVFTVMPMVASAQAPAVEQAVQGPNQPMQVAHSIWSGREEINDNGVLHFAFRKDGSVLMIDANSEVNGTWTQQGNTVTIRFSNCFYTGTITGTAMSGRAVATEGPPLAWNFNVNFIEKGK